MSALPTSPIAIYGCGTIGSSWAALFLAKGLSVRLYDISPQALDAGHGKALAALDGLAQYGLCERDAAAAGRTRIEITSDPRALLDGVGFVQESVLERYEVKREAHEAIERFAPPDAILASSTSGLLASQMQQGFTHPERFVVAHPFNPPHLVPLVELVPGPQTSEEALRKSYEFYAALGKVPVILRKEVPGHLANRLAAAVWREALDLVSRGVASLEDVDKALYAGPGLRWAFMGQHLIYHLNGGPGGYEAFFKHFEPAFETWFADLARWEKIPPEAKQAAIAQMKESAGSQDIDTLSQKRDEKLAQLVRVLYHEKD